MNWHWHWITTSISTPSYLFALLFSSIPFSPAFRHCRLSDGVTIPLAYLPVTLSIDLFLPSIILLPFFPFCGPIWSHVRMHCIHVSEPMIYHESIPLFNPTATHTFHHGLLSLILTLPTLFPISRTPCMSTCTCLHICTHDHSQYRSLLTRYIQNRNSPTKAMYARNARRTLACSMRTD